MTHQGCQAQMTDFELLRDKFMKGPRELAGAASLRLKCHIVVSLGRAAASLRSRLLMGQDPGVPLVLVLPSLGLPSRTVIQPACGILLARL